MKNLIKFLLVLFPVIVIGQTQTENYIKTTTYKVPTTVSIAIPKANQASQSVGYFDGLGRSKQTIAVRQGGDKLDNNLLDWKTNWIVGLGSIGTLFVQNGAAAENNRISALNPFGQTSTVWKCGSDAASDADGGWNSATIAIDKTRSYRYAVWVKRSGSQDGTSYHGVQNVVNLDGSANTNPYFWNGDLPALDKWYLMVGIVHPSTYAGGASGISGVYDTAGTKVLSGIDFKWSATTTTAYFRSYFYYAIDVNTTQYFYAPNLQKIDGSEASLAGLIVGAQAPDIVTHMEYDTFGRQEKEYLPYAVDNTGIGNIRTDAFTKTNDFYNTAKYQNTLNPYSAKEFEASPLNRVLRQAAPGNDWSLAKSNTIKLEHKTNVAGDNVKLFGTTATANTTLGLYETALVNAAGTTYYGAGQLYKTVTYDENTAVPLVETAGATVEFKNKEGQVVLKRTYGTVGAGSVNEKHDTYYIYDVFGNLTYVIPPKVDTSLTVSQTILNDLCYQYKYDYRNRLVEKKLPGKQWEFIVYDKLDRVVATGPAASPFPDLATIGWLITKYDVFDRPLYTGWMTSTPATTAGRKTLQDAQNATTLTVLSESKTTSGTIDGIAAYYTNAVAPTVFKLLTVSYYDNYTFPSSPAITIPTSVEGQTPLTTAQVKGMTTASWTRILNASTAVLGETTAIFYDAKARPIRDYRQNYLGGYTYIDSKLDPFSGQLQYSITRHKRLSGDTELITKDAFIYSDQDRLLAQTHQINNGAVELIAANSYDELGQLINKEVGNNTVFPTQKIDYAYNIRGWLTNINNMASLTQGTDPKDLFAFRINYNATPTVAGAISLYNGNISETSWKTASETTALERGYGYTYDDLNRLKTSIFKRNGVVNNAYDENLTYDKNGNIMSIIRNGSDENTAKQIDYLVYTYQNINSNRLAKVVDTAPALTKVSGFTDSASNTSDDYSYDANGNMITDANKGITTNIAYNHLNLPLKIVFPNGNITYLYNAAGQKVQKVVTQVTPTSSVTTTDYLGGYQYNNATLKFFPTAEGYVEPSGSSYKYIYQYKDHLGNVRLSYDKALVIQEENNYYPFGLRQQGYVVDVKNSTNDALKYKYNGKELQDELGLNMYDYGARNYDPALGRFMNVDPLAEISTRWSPYTYTYNNPVLFIDVDGLYVDTSWIYRKNKNGTYVNKNIVEAFEAFAKSKEGISFLSDFAEKDQVIAGHKYSESGKYDKKDIDLNYAEAKKEESTGDAYTTSETKGKKGLQITTHLYGTATHVPTLIDDIGHEAFLHVEPIGKDFYDDKKLNLSTVDKDIVKKLDDENYQKKWRENAAHHMLDMRYKILDQKVVPILRNYYNSKNIKKTDAQIRKERPRGY